MSVSLCSNSESLFVCFDNSCASPSITTSCEASFESNDIIIESEEVRSSRSFIDGILDTSRYLPPRSIPSSTNSLTLTKMVSGTKDQIPGFVIWRSPDRCESATSLGRVFVSRCSAKTFWPVLNSNPSAPLLILFTFVSIS